MQYLIDTYKKTGTLHHAYLIEGEGTVVLPMLIDFFKKDLGVDRHSPNLYKRDFDVFTIDAARALQSWSVKKAINGGRSLAALAFFGMTREAQNSLLKLFEEPTEHTHFFLVVPSAEILLPTLRSRLMAIPMTGEKKMPPLALSKDFISAPKNKRIELIKEIAQNKDKAQAFLLLQHLENILYRSKAYKNFDVHIVTALKEIARCKKYLHDRSPSVKMILEHIALITPVIK